MAKKRYTKKRKRNCKGRFAVLILCALFLAMSTACYAEAGAGAKFVRGLKNTAGGWLEIPMNIRDVSQEENILLGITYGALKGSLKTVQRTAVGVYDTGTFFIPEEEAHIEPATLF